MLVTVVPIITNDNETTNTQILVKQFEELRPNSVIEVDVVNDTIRMYKKM